MSRKLLWSVVCLLIAVQAILVAVNVHRESLTFDEDNHMFAGYMMWHAHDYGLNPEHPPFVKLLATVPLLGRNLWIPPNQNREFKTEAYLDGRDWLARNDGDRNQLVFQMRLAAGLLALLYSLVIFSAARHWFGDLAGLVALALAALDPNVMAHSALVTTDIGVSLFFLASIWTFVRWIERPNLSRLLVAGLVAGLLLATKHSGVLLAPMLLLVAGREVIVAKSAERLATLRRMLAGLGVVVLEGVAVLWGFYGFRYAPRANGMPMSTTLAEYVAPLGPHIASIINTFGRFHLLPESYLIGLVDVERMAIFYPTYLFGVNYSHGFWWYFPAVIAIKTTLGLLTLMLLFFFAWTTRRLAPARAIFALLVPALLYLGIAMISNMNIGARHLLPFYTFFFVLAGATVVALARVHRRWIIVASVCLVAHATSSLAAFPHQMSYGNELFGGPSNVHRLLSDANADWAQQLYQVKAWQDHHPNEECWFAYFATPEVLPSTYGIRCHVLPTIDTLWLGGADIVPPSINGTVLLSAGDLSGCEYPSSALNPYDHFQRLPISETIDAAVFVYRGHHDMRRAAAFSRVQAAYQLHDQPQRALDLATEAVQIDPTSIYAQQALGDLLSTANRTAEAHAHWQTALALARQQLDAGGQTQFVPELEAKLAH